MYPSQRINTASSKVIHIEVQVVPNRDFIPRTLFYQGRKVVDQIGRGKPYRAIKRTFTILLLDFTLLHEEPPDRYKNVFRFLNTISHKAFTDLEEIVTLELPKVPEEDDGTALGACSHYCYF
jgi:predicted transposase/invertase (TIGR01784 family)